MDWKALQDSMVLTDNDYPQRRASIIARQRVLDGEQYDHLGYPFSVEKGASDEYIPLDKRRPSVRSGWCRTVVDDSVSMLFGQGRWPSPSAPSEAGQESPTVAALKAMIERTSMAATMVEAATVGSVGSVAILFRVLKNKPFFVVFSTAYLAPIWRQDDPDALLQVTERRKVKRADLIAAGYSGLDERVDTWWFQRVWTDAEEVWYRPWPVTEQSQPQRDETRSAVHGLGLVPMVWVRNLPGGVSPDGACTFLPALDTEIEADYLLSQGGRGLKYSSDPTLLIKEPAGPDSVPARIGGSASALILSGEGDAKLLEISGAATGAVIEFTGALHKCAMGAMHGDGSDRDKMSTAQSGRAMELMKQPLVWLTSRLRMSYGDGALLQLLRMVCVASAKIKGGVLCGDKAETALDATGLTLVWPPFFHPTYDDKQAEAAAVSMLTGAALMSRRQAVTTVGESYDLADIDAELAEIAADEAAETVLLANRAAQTTVTAKQPADA